MRDTQFKNFAKLLMDELLGKTGYIDVNKHRDTEEIDALEHIIAKRAYDLVCHAIRSQAQGMDLFIVHDPEWMQERIETVSDIRRLPDE